MQGRVTLLGWKLDEERLFPLSLALWCEIKIDCVTGLVYHK
jgi:hypothetical protein